MMRYNTTMSNGTLMALGKFITLCKQGCFIDYDGYGKYAMGKKVSDKTIYPSDITGNGEELDTKVMDKIIKGIPTKESPYKKVKVPIKIDRSFTHVEWYNR